MNGTKIKNVTISEFRAFSDPKNGQFDFTIEDDITADFVSIYAPNGFGKTSFNDAVEWGITRQLSRFSFKSRENEKLIQGQKELNNDEYSIIRHHNAIGKTFVNINTNKENIKYYNSLNKGKIISKSEINVKGNQKYENREFNKVMLSQEWISRFLSEENGEKRYEIFNDHPDIVDLDIYYQGVKTLINTYYIQIKQEIISEIEVEEKAISRFEDENFGKNLNEAIEELKKVGILFQNTPNLESKNSILNFKDEISSRIRSVEKIISDLRNILVDLGNLKNGSDKNISISKFYENESLRIKFREEIVYIQELIKFNVEIINLGNTVSSEKDKLNFIKNLLESFQTYNEIILSLEKYNKDKSNFSDKGPLLLSEINKLKLKLIDLELELENLEKEMYQYSQELLDVSLEIEVNKENLQKRNNLLKLNSNIKNKLQDENPLNNEIKFIENVLQKLNDESIEGIQDLDPIVLELIKERETIIKQSFDITKIIEKLEIQISEQLNFNNDIEKLINDGIKIINISKQTNCPLCNYNYKEYNRLTDTILNSAFITNIVKDLQEQKIIHETAKLELDKILYTNKFEIVTILNDTLINKRNVLTTINVINSEINKNLGLNDEKLNIINKEIDAFNKKYFTINLSSYTLEKQALVKEKEKQIIDTKNSIEKASKEVKEFDNQYRILKEISNNASKSIYELELLPLYRSFNNYKIEIKVDYIAKLDLEDLVVSKNKKIESLNTDILSIEKKIKDIKNKLDFNDSIILEERELELNEKLKQIENDKNSLLLLASKNPITNFLNLNYNELNMVLEDRLKTLYEELEFEKKKLANLILLNDYTKNLEPFLIHENAKRKIIEYEKEIVFLDEKVESELRVEANRIMLHLKSIIKNFFHENLINEIYQRIDPHPELTKIEFIPNFDNDKPRLDIFVHEIKVDNGKEEIVKSLIPNFYFSTAQINILSLSIFLASALKSEKYDCIFLDDPIQSMDSINILSTIDLLRGIMINHDKQIILSTHDENFHNLLKKKIPRGLFKSKFLKFETFGKVVEDLN